MSQKQFSSFENLVNLFTSLGKKFTAGNDLLKDTVGYARKNLLNIPSNIQNATINGVTFTITRNSDGAVTEIDVDGTATADANFGISVGQFKLGDYIISGCPEGGNDRDTYNIRVGIDDTPSTWGTFVTNEYGNGSKISVTNENKYYAVIFRVYSGYIANHLKFYPMLRRADITDSSFVPYYSSIVENIEDISDNIEHIFKNNSLLGAKNLLTRDCSSMTIYGVNFTVNEDGSITVDGTASDNISFRIGDLLPDICPNNFIVNGLPSAGSGSTFNFRLGIKQSASDPAGTYLTNVISVDGYNLNLSSKPDYGISVLLNIMKDTVISNLTFRPMIRLASDSDDTYQPYTKTNKELTDGITQIYKNNGLLGAKNILQYPYQGGSTYTINGITYTVDSDNYSITINGTATADADFRLFTGELPVGEYILSQKNLNSLSGIIVEGYNGNTYAKTILSSGLFNQDNRHFSIDYDGYDNIRIIVRTRNTATLNDFTIYPMVRFASDSDDTYQPYAMTNKLLTDIANALPSTYADKQKCKVEMINLTTAFGADAVVPINIDTYENANGYIIRFSSGVGFSGTAPTGLGGNAFILIGFSSGLNKTTGTLLCGVQMAIGFGSNKIAIRTIPYTAAGANWGAWQYIDNSGGSGGAVIDDTTTANDKVWSSSKTKNYTDTAIANAISDALTASY